MIGSGLRRVDVGLAGRVAAVFLVALTVSSCAGGPAPPPPVPVPPRNLPGGREELLSQARREPFNANPGASARGQLESGAEVTIEPDEGAYRLTPEQLAVGRVVGKFINHSDQDIKELGLPARGESYWVVYRDGAEWYSAFIADAKDQRLDRTRIPTMYHVPNQPWQQSIAQWQLPGVIGDKAPGGGIPLMTTSSVPWVTCTMLGCCKPEL